MVVNLASVRDAMCTRWTAVGQYLKKVRYTTGIHASPYKRIIHHSGHVVADGVSARLFLQFNSENNSTVKTTPAKLAIRPHETRTGNDKVIDNHVVAAVGQQLM